jgi:hypothetical protein
MRKFLMTLFALSYLIIISCSIGVLKQNDIDSWLVSISGNAPPALDISGKWYDAKNNFLLGWGEGYLKQDQNHVSGAIGNYNIKGIVSGKKVYLVFIYGGSVYYTARLEMMDGLLVGNYFEADDKTQSNGYPTSFARSSVIRTEQ